MTSSTDSSRNRPTTCRERDLQHRLRRYAQLLQVGLIITSEMNFDVLFGLIIGQTTDIMEAERCSIFLIDKVLYAFLLTESMATFMGISILGGIVWRRANRWGALSSLVVAMAVNFGLYSLRGERLDHWDPNVFFIALVAGSAALVIVSILTGPEASDRIRFFFDRLQSPSDSPVAGGPAEAALEGKQLLLLNLNALKSGTHGRGFLQAYREDLVGFCVGWFLVAALVFLTWLLLLT